ncbi:lytic polysaccharide monooxygenase [Hydnomerulius pinastri MD-312]|uniref:lytic cellulose monooxygenase (C4-dehydrogenating) n=1 Tax=Hydnomerulius pinastri MD-312 TaxID=994086 RepID=A0A0C9W1C8_9AGAM|nr:lytic polysaccharide monooxygenase [Hydnomerulius pinastri MD-312]
MKSASFFALASALLPAVSAHYRWTSLVADGAVTTAYEYVRQNTNYNSPVTDVTSTDLRCNTGGLASGASTQTDTVTAGSTVGLALDQAIYHDGVVNIYMAKAPSGTDISSWDGSGSVWFKVHEVTAVTDGGSSISFPSVGMSQVTFTLPTDIPDGQYFIRAEDIALHVAQSYGGAQFYISCAQVNVQGGGSGTPGPLVAIPGVYTGYEPGILIDIYYPTPANYTQPGPAVWSG